MSPIFVQKIESWFENYTKQFKSQEKNYNQNINLKKEHTYQVCNEITRLGKSINLNKEDLTLAQTIALLHDVGRFEQYDRYGTFADCKFEEHAQLGVKILSQKNVLKEHYNLV
jgi:putative nucleotidyltransferase with HDIG domain